MEKIDEAEVAQQNIQMKYWGWVFTLGHLVWCATSFGNHTVSFRGSLPSPARWRPDSPLAAITDTKTFPIRTIGRLATGCTGTLIGRRHVLTAAHCVYSMAEDIYYDELEFSPGQNGEEFPFGTLSASLAYAPEGWTKKHDDDFDYALVILKEPIGDTVGWLGFGSDAVLPTYHVTITGYAGEKPAGTLWRSICQLKEVLPTWLNYPCETQGGMSGAGVVARFDPNDNHVIYGVHALGGEEFNSGVRITDAVFNELAKWKAAHP